MSSFLFSRHRRALSLLILGALWLIGAELSWGQPPQVSPVGFTKAQSHVINAITILPGSIESRTVSTLASEIPGLVIELAVDEGDRIDSGQILARLRTQNLEIDLLAAQAQLKEDEARRRFSEVNLKRARDMMSEGIYSQHQLDDAQFEADAWEGRIERLRAQIARINDDLLRSTIRAPFDGVVTKKFAEVGEWVREGGDLVEVLSMDALEVRVEVPERYYGQLKPGGQTQVLFDSLPGLVLSAPIIAVIPRADPKARTFPIRLELPSDRRLGVGMAVRVSIPVGGGHEALIVPKDAVVSRSGRSTVYRIDEDETVRPIPVETGDGVGEWIEVRGPLAEGDSVVTRGNERLRPGQKVDAKPMEYPSPYSLP